MSRIEAEKKPSQKYYYGDRVTVIAGFYTGRDGVVVGEEGRPIYRRAPPGPYFGLHWTEFEPVYTVRTKNYLAIKVRPEQMEKI